MYKIGYANCASGHALVITHDEAGHEADISFLYHDREPEYDRWDMNRRKFLGQGVIDEWPNVTEQRPYPQIQQHLRVCVALMDIGQCLDTNIPFELRVAKAQDAEKKFEDVGVRSLVWKRMLSAHPSACLVRALRELPECGELGALARALRERWRA